MLFPFLMAPCQVKGHCQIQILPYLTRAEHIIHILQEGFIFDLIVGEDEGDAFAFTACYPIQVFEVIHQVTWIVWPKSNNNTSLIHNHALQLIPKLLHESLLVFIVKDRYLNSTIVLCSVISKYIFSLSWHYSINSKSLIQFQVNMYVSLILNSIFLYVQYSSSNRKRYEKLISIINWFKSYAVKNLWLFKQ